MKDLLRSWLLRGYVFLLPLLLCACATTPDVPKVVKVPVPVACEIEQVEAAELPAATADMNVFELVQVALARLMLVEAENTRLRAANENPCPVGP